MIQSNREKHDFRICSKVMFEVEVYATATKPRPTSCLLMCTACVCWQCDFRHNERSPEGQRFTWAVVKHGNDEITVIFLPCCDLWLHKGHISSHRAAWVSSSDCFKWTHSEQQQGREDLNPMMTSHRQTACDSGWDQHMENYLYVLFKYWKRKNENCAWKMQNILILRYLRVQ